MGMTTIICPHCGNSAEKQNNYLNRAKKVGMKVFCSIECSYKGRRIGRSLEEKKVLKSEYDREFRKKNAERIKEKKHEYFVRTYNPEKASIERKKRMHKHIEYCRQPEYKEKKKEYDQVRRAKLRYGEFWESIILVLKIKTMYDTKSARQDNGVNNKTQKRKQLWNQIQKAKLPQLT